jgi:hypothetical protein
MWTLRGMLMGCARVACWVPISLFAGGCGGSSNLGDPAATATGGAGGRDAGAPNSGSAGASSLGPAQGSSHVTLVYNSAVACPITGTSAWNIPTGSLTNSTTVGSQIVDGSGGSTVSCAVRQSGGGFTVMGSLSTADNLSFSVSAGNLSPGSGNNAFAGTANISHYSPTSQTMRGSGCTITVSQSQGAQIGPGKIWADFDCPTFNPASASSGGCAAQGTFVFGNCAE